MVERGYIFELNYGERMKEKCFIKDILNKYQKNELVGAGIYVSNNPYNLQMLLHLNFVIDTRGFEEWLSEKHPDKKRKFNYFHGDIFESLSSKGYNIMTFIDDETVDYAISREPNEIFLFADKELTNSVWKSDFLRDDLTVFLSHSSKDKDIVDKIFNELQVHEVRAWYDKYEIKPGDSITDKINEGLENSNVGIICISKNFLNSPTGWTKSELNYFIQRRMRSGKRDFICLNFDVEHDELPPLVQDYRYIDMNDTSAIHTLVETLRDISRKHKNFA